MHYIEVYSSTDVGHLTMRKSRSTDHQDLLTVTTMPNDFPDVLEPGAGVPTPNQK